MIKWDRVNELREEIGQEDFDEVVDLFLEEVEQVINQLRTTPNPDTLREDLHFLKGSALNLGFHDFSMQCQAGETASAEGLAHTVDVPAILEIYEKSKQDFQSGLNS